jgi:hypothetical protein
MEKSGQASHHPDTSSWKQREGEKSTHLTRGGASAAGVAHVPINDASGAQEELGVVTAPLGAEASDSHGGTREHKVDVCGVPRESSRRHVGCDEVLDVGVRE